MSGKVPEAAVLKEIREGCTGSRDPLIKPGLPYACCHKYPPELGVRNGSAANRNQQTHVQHPADETRRNAAEFRKENICHVRQE